MRLTIAYDGRPFRGWQSQPHGTGVQDLLREALRALSGADAAFVGSGRTDAGVHALGQVAHVDVPADRYPAAVWRAALNARLPPTIRVLRCGIAPPGFHAQHGAKRKTYLYRVWMADQLHPLEVGRAWHFPLPVKLPLLAKAAGALVGTHDFAGFAANRRQAEENTVRTLFAVTVRRSGPLLTLRFTGDGFLYRMVRLLTGSLLQVAAGRREERWFLGLLTNPGGGKTNHCAPADGLYLASVRYR